MHLLISKYTKNGIHFKRGLQLEFHLFICNDKKKQTITILSNTDITRRLEFIIIIQHLLSAA